MSKYMRMIFEFEIEVTDPVAAAAYRMDWGQTEDGSIAMMSRGTEEEQITATAQQVLVDALASADAGIRPLAGSCHARPVVDWVHPSESLPPVPARADDGTFPAYPE